jgi:hypothetical protein
MTSRAPPTETPRIIRDVGGNAYLEGGDGAVSAAGLNGVLALAIAAAPTGITVADPALPDCPIVFINPAFTHRVFSTETAAAYIATHGSQEAQDAFASALSPVLQSDLFRLIYLLHHGGIYADADDRCRHSIAPLVSGDVELVLQQEDIGSIGNNFIAAAPGHPLIDKALSIACVNVLEEQGSNPWFITGPGVFSLAFAQLYGQQLANPTAPPPPGLRLLTQHQFSRRVSFHLQTPVKVSDGSWSAPRGRFLHTGDL